MTCPLCDSSRIAARGERRSPFVERAYTLFACSACGSAFFDLAQHEVDLERVYEDYAESSVAEYSAQVPASYYWKKQVAALQGLHEGPVRSVLDVGCRTGDFLMHWPQDVERTGIELSRRAADVARARGLNVIRGFVEDAALDHGFDVISCYALVEHLREPVRMLRHLPGRLNPRGILVILVPTRQCLKHLLLSLVRIQWHMYSPPQHLNFVSRSRLDRILADEGLRLASRRYTSGGMFNPLRRLPRLNSLFDRLMSWIDHDSPLNRLPLFDHMYSFYLKAR